MFFFLSITLSLSWSLSFHRSIRSIVIQEKRKNLAHQLNCHRTKHDLLDTKHGKLLSEKELERMSSLTNRQTNQKNDWNEINLCLGSPVILLTSDTAGNIVDNATRSAFVLCLFCLSHFFSLHNSLYSFISLHILWCNRFWFISQHAFVQFARHQLPLRHDIGWCVNQFVEIDWHGSV